MVRSTRLLVLVVVGALLVGCTGPFGTGSDAAPTSTAPSPTPEVPDVVSAAVKSAREASTVTVLSTTVRYKDGQKDLTVEWAGAVDAQGRNMELTSRSLDARGDVRIGSNFRRVKGVYYVSEGGSYATSWYRLNATQAAALLPMASADILGALGLADGVRKMLKPAGPGKVRAQPVTRYTATVVLADTGASWKGVRAIGKQLKVKTADVALSLDAQGRPARWELSLGTATGGTRSSGGSYSAVFTTDWWGWGATEVDVQVPPNAVPARLKS